LEKSGELKNKPTQMSVRQLLEIGIQADMLIVRSPRMLDADERAKIAMFCNLPAAAVISGLDMDSIYKVPLSYESQSVFSVMAKHFGLKDKAGDLEKFNKISDYLESALPVVEIAMVGKYFNVPDAYKSLNEALLHAGIQNRVRVNINKIDAESLEEKTPAQVAKILRGNAAILVPGGFGSRGILGKIAAARFARENKIPYLGICLGMQIAVIEFMRNVVGIKDADSTEFSKTCTPVIDIMAAHDAADMGGTLRLGAYPCMVAPGTLAEKIYRRGAQSARSKGARGIPLQISERHRHRYELNIEYEKILAQHGMVISGKSPDGRLPEIIEIPKHPFFIAGQFHPEFNSSPYTGHPLFSAFIKAAMSDK
jgi:CTP synthase